MAIRFQKGEAGGGFTPLPEGTYNLKIIEQESTVSKAGKPQEKVRFEVVDGPMAGRELNAWFSMQPQAIWSFEQLLEATGAIPTDTGEVGPDGRPILELAEGALLGCYVTAEITQNEWPEGSGRKTNRVNAPQECIEYAGPYDDVEPEPQEAAPEPKEKAPTPAPHAAPAAGRRRRRSVGA